MGAIGSQPPTVEFPMSTTAVIGLGILAWILLAILLAVLMGPLIRLRDRPHPDRTEPGVLAKAQSVDGAESLHAPPGWQLRNKT